MPGTPEKGSGVGTAVATGCVGVAVGVAAVWHATAARAAKTPKTKARVKNVRNIIQPPNELLSLRS